MPHLAVFFQETLNNWGATFFTYLKPPQNAAYNVSIASDNGALVWIDGILVVNNSGVLQHFCAFLEVHCCRSVVCEMLVDTVPSLLPVTAASESRLYCCPYLVPQLATAHPAD